MPKMTANDVKNLAISGVSKGEFEKAKGLYEILQNHNSFSTLSLHNLAVIDFYNENTDKALKCFRALSKVFKNNDVIISNFEKVENFMELQKGVDKNKVQDTSADIVLQQLLTDPLDELLLSLDDPNAVHDENQIIKNMDILQEIMPENFRILEFKAKTLMEADAFSEAASIYKEIFLNDDRNKTAKLNFLAILIKLEDLVQAEHFAHQFKISQPNDVALKLLIGKIHEGKKDFNSAEHEYLQALNINIEQDKVYEALYLLYSEFNEPKKAEQIITQAIKLYPDNLILNNLYGSFLLSSEQIEAAKKYFEKCILLHKNFSPAINNLGLAFQNQNMNSQAMELFDIAIKIEPKNPKYYFNLALAKQGLGLCTEAKKSFKKSYSLDRKNPDYELINLVLQEEAKTKTVPLTEFPIISNKAVDIEVVDYLYRINSIDLKLIDDPSFGASRGSEYDLFRLHHNFFGKLEYDFKDMLANIFGRNIFIRDSFYTIFNSGGGTVKHNHLTKLDKNTSLNLGERKYSLVYYLKTGDQNVAHPGYVEFEDPTKNYLPDEGMVAIFPASLMHSSYYNGHKDRVIIGINFYLI